MIYEMGLFMDTCPHNSTGCWFLGIISCELQVRTDELMFVLLEQPHQVRYQVRFTEFLKSNPIQ